MTPSTEILDSSQIQLHARFSELVHLVNRSYNTLKEVDRSHDMDNNHMLASIEQKMSTDNRKVWSRDLEREKKQATLENIMASRMRASPPPRNQGKSKWNIHHVKQDEIEKFTCWICKSSIHWVDQCLQLETMNSEDRLELM